MPYLSLHIDQTKIADLELSNFLIMLYLNNKTRLIVAFGWSGCMSIFHQSTNTKSTQWIRMPRSWPICERLCAVCLCAAIGISANQDKQVQWSRFIYLTAFYMHTQAIQSHNEIFLLFSSVFFFGFSFDSRSRAWYWKQQHVLCDLIVSLSFSWYKSL